MIFHKSQPAELVLISPPPRREPNGFTENMDASSPTRKAHAHEMHEKAGSISNTCELPWPVREDTKRIISTKPVWGQTAPVCSVNYPVARHHGCCQL
jgi:hypothetical protein